MLLRIGLIYALSVACLVLASVGLWQGLSLRSSRTSFEELETKYAQLLKAHEELKIQEQLADRRARVAEDSLSRAGGPTPDGEEALKSAQTELATARSDKAALEEQRKELEGALKEAMSARDAAAEEAQTLRGRLEAAARVEKPGRTVEHPVLRSAPNVDAATDPVTAAPETPASETAMPPSGESMAPAQVTQEPDAVAPAPEPADTAPAAAEVKPVPAPPEPGPKPAKVKMPDQKTKVPKVAAPKAPEPKAPIVLQDKPPSVSVEKKASMPAIAVQPPKVPDTAPTEGWGAKVVAPKTVAPQAPVPSNGVKAPEATVPASGEDANGKVDPTAAPEDPAAAEAGQPPAADATAAKPVKTPRPATQRTRPRRRESNPLGDLFPF